MGKHNNISNLSANLTKKRHLRVFQPKGCQQCNLDCDDFQERVNMFADCNWYG